MGIIGVHHIVLVDPHGLPGHVGKVCWLLLQGAKHWGLPLWDQDLVRIYRINICAPGVSVGLRGVESEQRDLIPPGQKLGVWWWIHTRGEGLFNSA